MLNQNLIIRKAITADNEPIRKMIFDVLREYAVDAEPDGDDLDAMEFGLNDMRINLVAIIDNVPAGSAILTEVQTGIFKLSKLFLPKKHRGKGIGKKLLLAAVEHAQRAQGEEIYLRTRDSYKEAVALYERAGWTRHPHELAPPGPPLKYSLKLTNKLD